MGLLALGLVLLGLEFATGAVSLAAVRLSAGAEALVRGEEFLIATPRYVGGLALLLGGVALYGGLVGTDLFMRHVAAGGEVCPVCGVQTRRVRRRGWQRALTPLLDASVTRRHCGRCGWSGLAT